MYYTLEKAAEVLSITPGDLNRLRESGKLRAFRDGSDWKFRKEDIDNYLTEQIKSRSAAADNDLLSDTDEETPTLLADSAAFEGLAGLTPDAVKINTNNDDVVVLDETPDGLSDGGSSGISLLGDEDDNPSPSSSDSGISLLDDDFFDVEGSHVDLGQEDIILGGSSDGSGSGLNLDGGSGIMLGSLSSGGSDSGISLLSDDNLFSLEPGTATEDVTVDSSKSAMVTDTADASASALTQKSDESDIFRLADEPLASPAAEPQMMVEPVAEDEDFQLAPVAEEDDGSDSESSSQVIQLEDEENLFMTDDSESSPVYGLSGDEEKPAPAPAAEESAAGGLEPFDNSFAGSDSLGGDFGGLDGGLGGDFNSADGFGTADGFDQGGFGADVESPFADAQEIPADAESAAFANAGSVPMGAGEAAGFGADGLPVVGGCSYAAGKGCRQETPFSTMSIWLGLVPCILILILAGIGAIELIRTIWSWEQPFSLTGAVLETIGGLINLI